MKEGIVKTYYEEEAREYDQEFYLKESPYPTLKYRHRYILDMVNAISFPKDAKVLDIGCGPGEMVLDLMRDDWEIWGIDIAQAMIDIANAKASKLPGRNKLHFATGDIEALRFEANAFDLVIISGVVEYLNDDAKWMREIDRVLKPGGVMVINVTNKFAVRKWTAPLIEPLKGSKALFKAMNFIKERVLRRGKLHHFPFRPRVHSPKAFDRFLAQQGFEKLSFRYFDFSIFVAPFDTLLGFVSIPIRKWMERFSHKNMVLNGTGYIVTARKQKAKA